MTRRILDSGAEQLPCTAPDHGARARAGSSVRVHWHSLINERACFSGCVLAHRRRRSRAPLSVDLAGTGPLGSVTQGPVPGTACVHVPSQCSLQNGQLLLRETAAAAAERISAVDGSCEKGFVDYILGREHGRRGGGRSRTRGSIWERALRAHSTCRAQRDSKGCNPPPRFV